MKKHTTDEVHSCRLNHLVLNSSIITNTITHTTCDILTLKFSAYKFRIEEINII